VLLVSSAGLTCYPNPDDLRGSRSQSGSLTCADFGTAWCAKFAGCEPLAASELFPASAPCPQRLATYCALVLQSETDTGWTNTALAACAASWNALSCADWVNDPQLLPGPACRVPGKRLAGASCSLDLQCSTAYCGFGAGASCGQCGLPTPQGGACAADLDCAAGLACSSSTGGACVPWGKLGDACDDGHPCLNTLRCTAGTCAARGGDRDVCADHSDCDATRSLLCNFTLHQCGPAVGGDTCDSSQLDGKVRYCSGNGRCNSDNNTCTKPAADGQPCSASGALCTFPAFCSTTTNLCTLPAPVDCRGSAGGAGGGGPDGGAGGADGGGPLSLSAAAASYASAVCNRFQACSPARLTAYFGSAATCQDRLLLDITSILAFPDVGWTAATLTSCTSARLAQSCADFNDGKVLAACVVAGARANGTGCRIADQCVSTRCNVPPSSDCGRCAALGAAAGACAADTDCQPPLVCGVATGAATGTCAMAGDLGAGCNGGTTPCRRSLSCRAGTCSTPGALGAACTGPGDCDDRNGVLCSSSTLRCVQGVGGVSCGVLTDGTVQYCSASGVCQSNGSCLPAAGDGQNCSSTGPVCLFPSTCFNNLCAPPTTQDCPR
jgi:hypothetical protein